MRILLICFLMVSASWPLIPNLTHFDEVIKITPRSESDIHIMSYNMWGLPLWVPKVGINNRFDKACETLVADQTDIVCLQECFSKRLRKKILKSLSEFYHHTLDYSCSNSIIPGMRRDCHGGLMTFSKFPIVEEYFEEYPMHEEMKSSEKIGHKGFLVTQIVNQVNDTVVVVNTHLYAGGKMDDEYYRMKQILYMDSILETRNLYSYKCILSGDLNVDHPEVAITKNKNLSIVYNYITQKMSFIDSAPKLNEDSFTVDATRNFYSNANDGRQKLDYILIRYPEKKKEKVWQIRNAESTFADANSFSDHLAWKVSYSYN